MAVLIATSCQNNNMSNDVISQNNSFSVTGTFIKEDSITYEAISGTQIISYHENNGLRSEIKSIWHIDSIDAHYPRYSSDETLVDALYNMAIDEINKCHNKNLSTHDISYAVLLALAHINPTLSMSWLSSRVKNGHVIQDMTADNHGWPIINDRIIWASAAWEVYKVSGDKYWLEYAYNVIKNTIEEDANIIFDYELRLAHGAMPVIDNDPSKYYPEWAHAVDILESMPLSTNILYANAYYILAEMADELKIDNNYRKTFKRLKNAINQNLWIEDNECYSAYLYGEFYRTPAPMLDNLGQALSIIWDIAEDDRAANLLANTPFAEFGIVQCYPASSSVKYISYPYLQAIWNMAAAKDGNESVLRHGLGALYRSAAIYGSHNCIVVSKTGEIESYNNSTGIINATGNIAMILHIFAGMTFHPYGIEFNPVVPLCIDGTKVINGFKYRQARLDITIEGSGNEIDKFLLDNILKTDNLIPDTIKGHHTIKIILKQGHKYSQRISFMHGSELRHLPTTPSIMCNNDSCHIYDYDTSCSLFINGEKKSSEPTFSISQCSPVDYFTIISAANEKGFLSTPFEYIMYDNNAVDSSKSHNNNHILIRKANKFNLSTTCDTCLTFKIETAEAGRYLIDLEYDVDSCEYKYLTYSIIVNTHKQGSLILPLSKEGEQSSNVTRIELIKGINTIQLKNIKPANDKHDNITLKYFRVIKNNFNN